jgi:hypothetical protein
MVKTIKEALEIVGGLSHTSKMPCASYGLPAENCRTGMALWKINNSVCRRCYALKGRYATPVVTSAQQRRLISLHDARWVEAMSLIILQRKYEYYRWHDSGDLQGTWHLDKIIAVAEQCSKTKFWLPTREIHMVTGIKIPTNLTIRISAHLLEEFDPVYLHKYHFPNSGVTHDRNAATCPSIHQGGKCGTCRDCWDKSVRTVIYHEH